MPFVNMTKMLQKARGKYAVGAFNILDYNSMKAVIKAAEKLGLGESDYYLEKI